MKRLKKNLVKKTKAVVEKEITGRELGSKQEQREKMKRHNWAEALMLYTTSQPAINLQQTALRCNIPYGYLRRRAAKERWKALRLKEQTAMLKQARTDFQQRMSREAITFDETSIDTAKLGQNIITARLIEISKMLAAGGTATDMVVAKLRAGEPLSRGDLFSLVNYKELASLAQAALMFQQIGRTALGSEVVDGSLLRDADVDGMEKVVSIGAELNKDDPQRLAAFLEVLERTGVTVLDMEPVTDADVEDTEHVQILEGEIIPTLQQIESGLNDVATN